MRWAVRIILALGLLGVPTSRGQSASVEELPLGSTENYDQLKAIAFSADSQHVAFLAVKGDKQFVVRDGATKGPFEWVIPASLVLSPGAAGLGFVIQDGNEMSVAVDGRVVGKGYYRVGEDRIRFSDDGKHYAFAAQLNEKGAVVVRDGTPGKTYTLASSLPVFSPDGNHLAYGVGLPSGKMCIVLDAVEQKVYEGVSQSSLQFSPDSKHLAYTAVQDKKFIEVVDGKEISKPMDAMWLSFSPDGNHIAFMTGLDKQYFVVIDGKEGPHFDGFNGSVAFSPDGKHTAYVGRRGSQSSVMLDGIGQEPFDEVAGDSLKFSPDSTRLAYAAGKGGERFIVVDGKRQTSFDHIARPELIFSPDSKRLAYAALRGQQFVVVLDGVESPRYERVVDMSFSSDSRHFAYRALAGQQPVIVVDAKTSQPYDALTPLTFSPDGKHYVYAALKGATASITVDGVDVPKTYTAWVRDSKAVFSSNDTADLLMARGRQLLHVRLKLR